MGHRPVKSSQENLTNTGIKNHDHRDREPLKVTWSDPFLSKSQVKGRGQGKDKAGRPNQEPQQWTVPW